jgi:predicted small integral membrane protein
MNLLARLGQTALTLTIGLYFVLVAFNNITDYGTNFQFVKHVLSMDSLPPDPHVAWHAIRSQRLQHLAYCFIIAWEALAGLLCVFGGVRMALDVKSVVVSGFHYDRGRMVHDVGIPDLEW